MFAHTFGITADGQRAVAPVTNVALVDSTMANSTSTIPVPSYQQGDILICFVFGTNSSYAADMTGPSGWTKIENNFEGGDFEQGVFSKTASSSEPADYTFGTSTAGRSGGVMVSLRNYNSTQTGVENNSFSNVSWPALTANNDGAMFIFGAVADDDADPLRESNWDDYGPVDSEYLNGGASPFGSIWFVCGYYPTNMSSGQFIDPEVQNTFGTWGGNHLTSSVIIEP